PYGKEGHVWDRDCRARSVRLRLFRALGYQGATLDILRDRHLRDPARHGLRSASRDVRGMLPGALALLGGIVGLPPGLRRGWRSGAANCGGSAGSVRHRLSGRRLYFSAIVSLAATLLLPDYTNKDISAH